MFIANTLNTGYSNTLKSTLNPPTHTHNGSDGDDEIHLYFFPHLDVSKPDSPLTYTTANPEKHYCLL